MLRTKETDRSGARGPGRIRIRNTFTVHARAGLTRIRPAERRPTLQLAEVHVHAREFTISGAYVHLSGKRGAGRASACRRRQHAPHRHADMRRSDSVVAPVSAIA